jgi:hypothetical protein
MGFFASLSRGWSFMKQAFSMAMKERRLLKPSVYLVLVTILYFVGWVAVFVAADLDAESDLAWVLGACATFGSFLIFYFFCGMTVNMIDRYLEGHEPTVGEAFRDARQNFLAICALAVISTVVELIAKAARRRGGRGGAAVVMSILASIIETLWTIVSFLLLPAIIIEDISLRQALRRVRELHKDNKLLIGVGEVGVRAVTGIIGFLVCFLIFGVVYASLVMVSGTPGIVLALVLGGTILSLFAAFNVYLRMAYYTCLYLWAVETERKGAEADPPLPLAIALGKPARDRIPIIGSVGADRDRRTR